MNEEEILKIIEELKESVRYKTIIPNEERKEWKREYDAIQGLLDLYYKQQDEIEELKLDLHEMTISNNHKKENWVCKEVLNSYIRKDKIKEIFDTKIYNCKYLSETDWTNEQKVIDLRIADILKIILDELLEE